MSQSRPQLSLSEQLWHAIEVRSPKGAAATVVGVAASRVAPRWWKEQAPWYAGRIVDTLGLKVRLDRAEFHVPDGPNATSLRGLLWLERYETLERHAITQWLPRDLPAVEFGASIGVVSCLVNRHLRNPAAHICVEANPAIIPVLQRNRDSNRCSFRIVHAALAYGVDSVEFGISESIVESSVLNADAVERVSVPTIGLATLLDDARFDSCSLVCDVEGAEGALVAHEGRTLAERVNTVILEVHPGYLGDHGVAKLAEQMKELGFSTIWQRGDVWVLQNRRTPGHR
jgi:FkbM family methyltransferase